MGKNAEYAGFLGNHTTDMDLKIRHPKCGRYRSSWWLEVNVSTTNLLSSSLNATVFQPSTPSRNEPKEWWLISTRDCGVCVRPVNPPMWIFGENHLAPVRFPTTVKACGRRTAGEPERYILQTAALTMTVRNCESVDPPKNSLRKATSNWQKPLLKSQHKIGTCSAPGFGYAMKNTVEGRRQ
jgi:hypothetical protein